MIINEIKKASLQALKDKDSIARSIYGIIINKYNSKQLENRVNDIENTDADMIKIIQKTSKELLEEKENYIKAGNEQQAEVIEKQRSLIEKYLPKMMTESEIKDIIKKLDDKSISNIMKYFKENHNGECEMATVSKVAREFQ